MSARRVRAVARGRVQGVAYRAFSADAARAEGLAGWVRNRADGSVEALFVGPLVDVATMLDKCRRGPPAARVDEIVREVPVSEPLDEIRAARFRKLPTL